MNGVKWFTRDNTAESLLDHLHQQGFALAAIIHQSGGLCLLAHPGRTDGFMTFDTALLDQLRREAPIDGLEVYHPRHTSEQTTLYLDYAKRHNLLISAGSDSHGPNQPPIKYPAHLARALLERPGIEVD